MVEEKHIVKLQGKDFVTYEGLIDSAHKKGLKSIKTELVHNDNNLIIFKAIAEGEQGEYHGYGDATDQNVGRMVLPHKIRMAETRAKARALRDYCNIGMCSIEELSDNNESNKPAETLPPTKTTTNYDFLNTLKSLKFLVGNNDYYSVLSKYKYEHANLICDKTDQTAVYKELCLLAKCPECDAQWDVKNKRCSANCQTREV